METIQVIKTSKETGISEHVSLGTALSELDGNVNNIFQACDDLCTGSTYQTHFNIYERARDFQTGDKVIIEGYKGMPVWKVIMSFVDNCKTFYIVESMAGDTSNIAFINNELQDFALDYFTKGTQKRLDKILCKI